MSVNHFLSSNHFTVNNNNIDRVKEGNQSLSQLMWLTVVKIEDYFACALQ